MIVDSLDEAPKQDQIQKALGKAFWGVANHYSLDREDQAILLGLKVNRQRLVALQKKNEIPDSVDCRYRVKDLLGIHKNLRILFPNNRDVVYKWFKTKRDLFSGQSAMEFIKEGGDQSIERLHTVKTMLDQIRVSN